MSEAREVWHIRGEGGGVFEMSPPFGEGITARLKSGALRRVNADGSPYQPGAAVEVPTDVAEEQARQAVIDAGTLAEKRAAEQLAEQAGVIRLPEPDRNARKSEWVLFAASTGEITPEAADNLSRTELIARFGG